MKNLITIGLPSKGRLKEGAVHFFKKNNYELTSNGGELGWTLALKCFKGNNLKKCCQMTFLLLSWSSSSSTEATTILLLLIQDSEATECLTDSGFAQVLQCPISGSSLGSLHTKLPARSRTLPSRKQHQESCRSLSVGVRLTQPPEGSSLIVDADIVFRSQVIVWQTSQVPLRPARTQQQQQQQQRFAHTMKNKSADW